MKEEETNSWEGTMVRHDKNGLTAEVVVVFQVEGVNFAKFSLNP